MTTTTQGTLPPATPTYVLRGHATPIHALHFYRQNLRLISGDADGWIVIWSTVSKRPVAVWKAHENAILGVGDWDEEKVVTHGRDHRLRVWQLRERDETGFSVRTPVEGEGDGDGRRDPWLLHELPVNALNFCAFGMCHDPLGIVGEPSGATEDEDEGVSTAQTPTEPIIIAVPNTLDSGGVDFLRLPTEKRVSTLEADKIVKTGMIMVLKIFTTRASELCLVSGYEDGHTMVHRADVSTAQWKWRKLYTSRPQTQPLLSLDVSLTRDYYITTSADANVVKHPIPAVVGREDKPIKIVNTKHAGQQGAMIRSDDKIFATAGWDGRMRVYSSKSLRELAVLKWHKDGCYSVAFATMTTGSVAREGSGPRAITTLDAEGGARGSGELAQQHGGGLEKIKQQRSQKAQDTHWLAAGGKDGKISLWDIY